VSPKRRGTNNNQNPQVDLTLTEQESGNQTSKKHHSNIQAARSTQEIHYWKKKNLSGAFADAAPTQILKNQNI